MWLQVRAGALRGLISVFSLGVIEPASIAQDIVVNPPDGFETTVEENRTQVDILYRGVRIGVSMARFDDSEITFEDPDQILRALPELRDPERVAQALARPQPVNADRVCESRRSGPLCGFIHARDVAVIFNQGTLEAELFISPLYTYERDPRGTFLPTPTIAPGLISSVSSRAVYDFKSDRWVGNHRLRSIAGHGRFAIRGEAFATGEGDGEFTALYATHSGDDRAWSAGLIPPQSNGGLARSRRMFGVRFGTMLETRLDQEMLYAIPLDVSISQAANVEIQRDGQTLDVQNLRAGDRTLDISRLPPGSYTVDLLINEGGDKRRETRFYSTTGRLPPRGAPRWYVELGNAVPLRRRNDGFEDTDPVALALGWRQRVAGNLGVWMDGFFSNDSSFLEAGGRYIQDGLRADLSMLASDRGSFGATARGSLERSGWSLDGSAQHLNTVTRDIIPDADTYSPFRNSFTQFTASAARAHKWGRYGLRGYYRNAVGGNKSWFAGPFADIALFQTRQFQFNLNLQAEQSDIRQTAFLGVRLSRTLRASGSSRRRLRLSSRVDANYVRNRSGGGASREAIVEGNAGLDQVFGQSVRARIDAGLRHQGEVGAFARGTYTAPWISATMEGRRNYQNQSTALLNVNTGMVLGGGRISLHNTTEESGLHAHLSSVRDVPIAIVVNQQTRRTVPSDQSAFVPLQSYAIYDVGIQPSTAEDLAYEQQTERLIAYPGNVMRLDRSVQPVMIIVGQLINTKGVLVTEALLRTTETLGRTDEEGFFQIDIVIGETVRVSQSNGEVCRFVISEVTETAEPYVNLGQVTCN